MSDVECDGTETNIDQCAFAHKTPGSNCTHADDVIVECYGTNLTGKKMFQPLFPAKIFFKRETILAEYWYIVI